MEEANTNPDLFLVGITDIKEDNMRKQGASFLTKKQKLRIGIESNCARNAICVGQKFHSGFSIISYGKSQLKFLVNPN